MPAPTTGFPTSCNSVRSLPTRVRRASYVYSSGGQTLLQRRPPRINTLQGVRNGHLYLFANSGREHAAVNYTFGATKYQRHRSRGVSAVCLDRLAEHAISRDDELLPWLVEASRILKILDFG